MALLDRFVSKPPKGARFKIANNDILEAQFTTLKPTKVPSGKGEVEKEALITREIGVPHFENYQENEDIVSGVPIITAAIEKTVDFVVGDGYRSVNVAGEDSEDTETFMREQDFDNYLRTVARHLLMYGNCYTEIISTGGKVVNLKILSPANMYVVRDNKGIIKGYAQIFKDQIGLKKPIKFKPEEIAHFKVNVIGDRAYGMSIIHPMKGIINKNLNMEENTAIVVDRKTNAPLHIKLGTDDYPAEPGDITSFKSDLRIMKADHEWVTGHGVEMSVVGFQGKILDVGPWAKYLQNQLVFGSQVPLFLLGIPEGSNRSTAAQQMDAFHKRKQSVQLVISSGIEQGVFAKLSADNVQLIWGLGRDDRLEEISSLSRLMDGRLLIPLVVRIAAAKRLNVLLRLGAKSSEIETSPIVSNKPSEPEDKKKEKPKSKDEKKPSFEELYEKSGWGEFD